MLSAAISSSGERPPSLPLSLPPSSRSTYLLFSRTCVSPTCEMRETPDRICEGSFAIVIGSPLFIFAAAHFAERLLGLSQVFCVRLVGKFGGNVCPGAREKKIARMMARRSLLT